MTDPADKYRDKLDPLHKMAMEAIGMASVLLRTYRRQYEALLEAERDAHSIGHITHPEIYRDMIHSKSFAQQIALCKAAQEFVRAVDVVLKDVEV